MLGIELKRGAGVPMARQLYRVLSEKMTDGSLPGGSALPSTRELARQLGISRNTACEAYEMLASEGFIISRPGAATRVAQGLALEKNAVAGPEASALRSKMPYIANFRTGKPELRQFPLPLWRQLMRKGADELTPDELDYTGQEGLPALRGEIARWLLRSRGLEARPQDIFITAGTMQVLALLPAMPALRGGTMLLEDPCHVDIMRAWQEEGIPVLGLPVDGHGARTDLLGSMDLSAVSAIYVTPSHQFPMGGILPAGRRAELIRLAREHNLYIIEDDYDSEFRYSGAPVAPLRSADPERVIYTGTFSKTLFPAIRIGFVILPAALQSQWLRRRRYADIQSPPFGQAALAEMLRTRKFDRHVQRMRRLYSRRREALLRALDERFRGRCEAVGDAAGLHVAVRFHGRRFGREFVALAKRQGVYAVPAERYAIHKGLHEDMLILGFGHLNEAEIKTGVDVLYRLIAIYE